MILVAAYVFLWLLSLALLSDESTGAPEAPVVVPPAEPDLAEPDLAEPDPFAYGDDASLDALWDACGAADVDACAQLYRVSPLGSAYETFAARHFPVSAQDVLEYEQLLKQRLEPGAIVYSTPDAMRVGDREAVTVRLTREDVENLDKAADDIFAGLPGDHAAIRAEKVEVGATMRATLEGEGWNIVPVGAGTQRLRLTGHREWQWIVEPLNSGALTLHLTVYVSHNGEDVDNVTFRRTVGVAVHPWRSVTRFGADNWQWGLTTLISSGLLAAAGRRLVQRRRRPPGTAIPTPDRPSGYL